MAIVALAQPDADRRHHLHAVGKAHHHDQRRHHVEEQVELEAHPAQKPQRPRHGEHGRQRCDHHQRDAPEEDDRDQRAEEQAETVVDELVALDRVADLELHHRGAGELGREAGALEQIVHGGVDLADDDARRLLVHDLAVERDDDERELAVVGQELALDDVVGLERRDDRVVGGPFAAARRERWARRSPSRRAARAPTASRPAPRRRR